MSFHRENRGDISLMHIKIESNKFFYCGIDTTLRKSAGGGGYGLEVVIHYSCG